MTDLYFDDFKIGDRFVSPGVTVSEGMILDFAMLYDPQPFHIDVEAAKASPFGGLIASGFQTLSLGFRMFLMTGVFRACSIGSPGLRRAALAAPGAAGRHPSTASSSVLESRPSRSKADRGMMITKMRVINQRGEDVLTFSGMQLRAPPGRLK